MSLLVQSCIEEPENPQIAELETSRISQVRDWFETNKTNLRLPERGSNYRTESQELILPFFEKEPDWDQFHHYYFPDGREVFETSLENAIKYFPIEMSETFSGQNPSEIMIQNIMFVRHATLDQFNVVIARYYPGDETSKANFNEISYNQIPILWTGKLELFTYEERFFVGFEFEEGKMMSSYTRRISSEDGKRQNMANMDVRCVSERFPVGYKVCTTGTTGVDNCTTTITHWVEEYTCFGADGGRPSYVYIGIGGGDDERDPAPDGGGAACSTCADPPEMPMPKREEIKINLDPCHKDIIENLFGSSTKKAKSIIRKFQPSMESSNRSNIEFSAQFSYGTCKKLTARGCTSGSISEGFVNITVPKDRIQNITEFGFATAMIHELLHAYLVWENKVGNDEDLNTLLNLFAEKYNNPNEFHHNLFVEAQFIGVIADALKDYAISLNYNGDLLGDQYFEDLAWMGLRDTDVYKSKDQDDKDRIESIHQVETFGKPGANSLKACN